MIKFLTLISTFLILLLPTFTFAIDVKVENAYTELLYKLEQKYSVDMQETILKDLNSRLELFWENTKSSSLLNIIDELQLLNNEKLYDIWLAKELSPAKQKVQELREISAFEKTIENKSLPSYVSKILGWNIKYIATDTNRQFIENKEIKRIAYSSYIPMTETNSSKLQNKKWIVIYDESNWYRFIDDYSFEIKIPYSEISKNFSVFLTQNHKISLKNNDFYWYNFLKSTYFQDKYWLYESEFDSVGFNYKTTLLNKGDDGTYSFVTDYSEYKIARESDLYGIPEKHLLLDYLRDDTKFETSDISAQISQIRTLANSLTERKNREQSIKAIYAWILDNIEYSKVLDFNNQKIFSWIETFKNGDWVCTGYTKLSSYLFYFAGYHDVEVIQWNVIDAQDFPQIWHAWLKIWDLYYDPTFDDPIGAKNTKTSSDYKYFWLPKDIFYANRYEYGDLPEFLLSASETEIREHIFNKLSNLIPKYQSTISNYPVFWEVNFRNMYNIPVSTTITPKLLAEKIGSYTVENNSLKFMDNWIQRQIISIDYYIIDSDSTQSVLNQLWYKTDSLTLLNWQTESGQYEWRLAHQLQVQ